MKIFKINLKTIYFNFKYLPFKQAVRLPFFVSRYTRLIKMKGRVFLHIEKIKPSIIKLGCLPNGMFESKYNKTKWEIEGDVHFYGTAEFKYGAALVVGKKGVVSFGNWFKLSAKSSVLCYKKITFGDNVHISWETIFMDTDMHKIHDKSGRRINEPAEIVIGDRVWIGMRSTFLKGAKIEDDNVVASNTLVTKHIHGSNQIIAGIPARIIKKEISWED